MERKFVTQDLVEWKNSPNRKPLVLQGARQIGKTYAVNEFGQREYANVVSFNFEKEQNLKGLFTDMTPSVLLPKLEYCKRAKILPRQTLVIFDEVQACPEALASLKYFCMEIYSDPMFSDFKGGLAENYWK